MVRNEYGAQQPQAFMPYRINGQYIIEGLTAGFFFALGGGGFIMIDRSMDLLQPKKNRYLLAAGGAALIGSYRTATPHITALLRHSTDLLT